MEVVSTDFTSRDLGTTDLVQSTTLLCRCNVLDLTNLRLQIEKNSSLHFITWGHPYFIQLGGLLGLEYALRKKWEFIEKKKSNGELFRMNFGGARSGFFSTLMLLYADILDDLEQRRGTSTWTFLDRFKPFIAVDI